MSDDYSNSKKITFGLALIPIVFLILSLFVAIQIYGADPHIPLVLSTVVAAAISIKAGYKWNEIEEGMVDSIKMSMQAVLILMIIGMLIGTWILSGVVPTMIYYGLQILSPGIFLIATTILSTIVALSTGSSWTTAGTVGIALIGIGEGLGIPLPIVAGAIISGAYAGDKMSPLSDTTNLAPAMAGSNIFDHIRHMLYTTGPSYVIALILYGIIGMRYSGAESNVDTINVILEGLSQQFTISPLLFIAPLIVIALVVFKIPAIPGLIGGVFVGGILAVIFQGANLGDIIEAAHYGFESTSGIESVDELLSGGGLDGMMWTVSLILAAMSFGGVMEKTGMLYAIAEKILSFANSTGSLVLSTILTAIGINLVAGDQYLSIVIPGRMYKDIYRERGLHPKNLSRVLEDSGTLTSPLVPWNTCGSFMYQTLGVHPFAFAPFAFVNLLNPLISIFYGFTGLTMEKLDENQDSEKVA
ncbi:Na+/H+ antiporter NhaC [Clostridium sp. D2Q-14]|uniref:Na+/H+ antiporter NhaC n=1 Tax=Anaeromonas gelatinilytica TaxID=2683194 RepID=UPI00193C73C4|nr:Na+/H+ antiporter NhaC [Anaeromonas gelatinilytica]MBS4536390.1 Na+/H+ antiporter NhaC [Anaeromonas gelatinilytica]